MSGKRHALSAHGTSARIHCSSISDGAGAPEAMAAPEASPEVAVAASPEVAVMVAAAAAAAAAAEEAERRTCRLPGGRISSSPGSCRTR